MEKLRQKLSYACVLDVSHFYQLRYDVTECITRKKDQQHNKQIY